MERNGVHVRSWRGVRATLSWLHVPLYATYDIDVEFRFGVAWNQVGLEWGRWALGSKVNSLNVKSLRGVIANCMLYIIGSFRGSAWGIISARAYSRCRTDRLLRRVRTRKVRHVFGTLSGYSTPCGWLMAVAFPSTSTSTLPSTKTLGVIAAAARSPKRYSLFLSGLLAVTIYSRALALLELHAVVIVFWYSSVFILMIVLDYIHGEG